MKSDIKKRLKALQALAERGVGGEKETAKRKLEKLLAANNMTEDNLKEDEVRYYLFSYSGAPYKPKLLQQVIYKILGHNGHCCSIYKSKGTRNKFGVYCTPAQKLEIDLDYEFYCNLFDQEIEILLDAFIQKQELFPEDAPHNVINFGDLTPEERAHFLKMQAFESSLTKRQRAAGLIETSSN